ncbi:DNA-binding protein WhiA [Pseudonocardia parietis]|uniref:DNA-binding protein WhiA n=1 Tax=Pseudonocardia parietis TaxID=570936 RepID=A0ABS4VKJ3_9PSEU|nr:DNA-binding protein WhiA [Pseudonocardia parietis]MBP2364437.1 DNA-binding protein WhiA [Pseudonocardia parietis]
MFDPERITAELHRELGAVREERPAVRQAGVVTQLRLAGDLTATGGHTVVRAEFPAPELAVRLCRELTELYGRAAVRTDVVTAGGRPLRYFVKVTGSGSDLARATGLVDRLGRPVLGLPPAVVGGGAAVAAGVWRGALLARGRIVRPSGRARIHVTCPGPAVVLALVGAARALGVLAAGHETATEHRVVVRDPESVDTLLRATGAEGVADVLRRCADVASPVPSTPSASLETVNARRAAEAADRTTARVRWALDVLGAGAPSHLRAAGLLRVEHATLSLSRLGLLADPPMSKDAVAGRLRRLVVLAEEHAGPS